MQRKRSIPAASLAILGLLMWGCASTGVSPAAGTGEWQNLVDGSTLAGWSNPYDWGEAWVENGEIRLRADKKFFLVTGSTFRDFVFEGEVMVPDTASNAGFMFRANVEPNKVYGYQAEVDPKSRRWSGGLYDEGRRGWLNPPAGDTVAGRIFREGPGRAFVPGRWNRYRIEAVGDSLKIYVNDTLTTGYRDSEDREGYIGIQHHGEAGKVYRYRNLRIRPVSADDGRESRLSPRP